STGPSIRVIDGDSLRLGSRFGSMPPGAPDVIPLGREYPSGRTIMEGRTIHIGDLGLLDATEYPDMTRDARTVLATPLLRKGVPIGAILIRRADVGLSTAKQTDLLKTFGDQPA